jgi:hypothetical protein
MDDAQQLAQAIASAEIAVATSTVEMVIVLDVDGRTRYTGAGERDRVSAPINVLRGSIVIHNHPAGGSLSRQDVRLMLAHEIAQMRVVSAETVYVLDLPEDVAWEEIEPLVVILTDEVRERHRDLILDGKMTYEESEQRRWHEIWTGVAEIRGWGYRTVPRLTP